MRTVQEKKKIDNEKFIRFNQKDIPLKQTPHLQTSYSLDKFEAESGFDQNEMVHCLGVRQTHFLRVSTQNTEVSELFSHEN